MCNFRFFWNPYQMLLLLNLEDVNNYDTKLTAVTKLKMHPPTWKFSFSQSNLEKNNFAYFSFFDVDETTHKMMGVPLRLAGIQFKKELF